MKVAAVIPARGGSVAIPRKNIRPLNGVPLVGRTIGAARASKVFDKIYVSSDSDEILEVGSFYGADPIKRPAEISGSTATSESALLHALTDIERRDGRPDVIFFLQCTSPFTTASQIAVVYSRLIESGASAAFTAIEDHGFVWAIDADGLAKGVTHNHTLPRLRRQDMAPRYRENGAIYAMRVEEFLQTGTRFCGSTILVPVDGPAIEIDTERDWLLAEAVAPYCDNEPSQRQIPGTIRALVTDFDGVHTDDRVMVGPEGQEFVLCSRADGMGIEIIRNRGLKLLILSREKNEVVNLRGAKLQMEVLHDVSDKLPALDHWRREHSLGWDEIAYIGNDVNDIECMRMVGMSFAPHDAHPLARRTATVVLSNSGGRGALRELCEYLINRKLIA